MSMHSDNDFDLNWDQEERKTLAQAGIGATIDDLKYGDVSDDASSIVGDNGFMYIKGGSNQWDLQLAGDERISDEELHSSLEVLENIRRECSKRSIAFSLVIIPEKDAVYPEESPNCRGVVLGQRSVHQLQALFAETIYPLAELEEAKSSALLYHKRDSHFNFFGGFIIFNRIARALGIEPLDYDDTPAIHTAWQNDLAVKWEKFPLMRRTLRPDYDEEVIAAGAPLTGHHIKLTAHSSDNDDCAIVYGDSYAWNPDAGISRFLTRRYKTVHFIWSRRVNWDLITELAPKALIMESAERFLVGGLFRA